ncbi:hypothetical protein [Streptomyces sp. B1I3]|uniref:hypothetical protein n=1 Tax=Streptomyces sp. B1I3 TaxID=3042264 RepID=UPI00277DF02D|nr:hypothetical protein [Streptomyces sp. B1I3]MDQ0794936.1 hypothetical protein [Streptomyces sp. B1I3]
MRQVPVTAERGTQVVTLSAPSAQDRVALAEIELCGELMIAASAAPEDRLSHDRIDEVLNVRQGGDEVLPGGTDAAEACTAGCGPAPRIPRQSHRRG